MSLPQTAADLMTAQPMSLNSLAAIQEAMDIFLEKKIVSLPIMTLDAEVAGLFTEVSLIKAILQFKAAKKDFKNESFSGNEDLLESATCVKESMPIAEVIRAMIKSKTYRVLVVNEMNTLVGIISPRDVIRYLQDAIQ